MRILRNSVPVLVLISSQHGGLGIIRSLGRKGIPVYGVHRTSSEPAAHSRFLRRAFVWDFASATAANSVGFLMDVAEKLSTPAILIPTSDVTVPLLAENAGQLAKKYIFITASTDVVRCFLSKKQTHDLCRRLGIPTAKTASAQSWEEVLDFVASSKFPVIVKSLKGEFLLKENKTTRVAIVADERALLDIFHLNSRPGPSGLLLQEYIAGSDDTVWMFNGYFDEQTKCLFGATGRKLRQFPAHCGTTSLGVCQGNKIVEAQTLKLMQAVNYQGPLDIGYRFDARDGQYKLLDVNPRIGATFRLFTAENGLDVSRVLYLHLTRQSVPPAQIREARKWIVESNDLVSSLSDMWKRQLTLLGWLKSLQGIQEGVWLTWDDLAPLAMAPLLYCQRQIGAGANLL
jgi:D-aspartate ligase